MKKCKTHYFICMSIVFVITFFMTVLIHINNSGNFAFRVYGAESQAKAGWNLINGKWFYYDENGYRLSGWINDGGNKYYLKIDGSMATGWVKAGTKWYYFYSNGAMAFNTSIDGYMLGADGAWITEFDISDAFNTFGYPYNQREIIKNKVDEIVQSIIKDSMSDFEKEKALHDYLVSNTRYDYENYIKKSVPSDSYTAYGALINGTAVCQGYAEAMYLLLSSAGIDTDVVTGSANNGDGLWQGHAWNIVKIGGEYYQLDPTWNDPVTNGEDIIRYSYFNVTDDKLSYDHNWVKRNYPKSTGVRYNYRYYTYCTENNIPIDKEPLTIYGTVSLPDGEYAPKGGLPLKIAAETESKVSSDNKNYFKADTFVIIPEGHNSTTYSLGVPQTSLSYNLYYNLVQRPPVYTIGVGQSDGKDTTHNTEQDCKMYFGLGYYSSKGTVSDKKNRSLVGGTNKYKADLTIIKGNKVTGTISLPNGEVAPEGGIKLFVEAGNGNEKLQDKEDYFNISASATILKGSNSAAYSLVVPPSASGYSVKYRLYEGSKEYSTYGYYSSKGTTSDYNSKTLMDRGNKADINLTVLKAVRISGIISLPKREATPKGGLKIRIYAESDNGTPQYFYDDINANTDVIIPEGTSSVPYSLYVPSSSRKFTVRYYIEDRYDKQNSEEYLPQGYYSDHGTVWNQNEKTQIDLSNTPVIDLSILKRTIIEGTAAFPSGEAAPEGGLELFIMAHTADWTQKEPEVLSYHRIPEGTKSVDYRIIAPIIDSGYIIQYWYSGKDNKILNHGYYSDKGMVTNLNEATVVGKGNSSGVNLTIIKAGN